jgi:hypothetical protein
MRGLTESDRSVNDRLHLIGARVFVAADASLSQVASSSSSSQRKAVTSGRGRTMRGAPENPACQYLSLQGAQAAGEGLARSETGRRAGRRRLLVLSSRVNSIVEDNDSPACKASRCNSGSGLAPAWIAPITETADPARPGASGNSVITLRALCAAIGAVRRSSSRITSRSGC